MAINYDWYENPNNGWEENGGIHPRPAFNGRTSTQTLLRHASNCSALSVGTLLNALETLTRLCAEELREGREVHIDGLGSFAPTLETSEPVRRNDKYKHTKVQLKGISFRPDESLKREVRKAKFRRTKLTRPDISLTEEQIDTLLTKHFAEHDLLSRLELQYLCGMSRSTAYRHLKRLQEEGKLKRIGRVNQPLYCPLPGYYGVSREVRR